MERRAEYITQSPEYHAAGLDLIQAELTIVALTMEIERLGKERLVMLALIRRMQEQIKQLENQ